MTMALNNVNYYINKQKEEKSNVSSYVGNEPCYSNG